MQHGGQSPPLSELLDNQAFTRLQMGKLPPSHFCLRQERSCNHQPSVPEHHWNALPSYLESRKAAFCFVNQGVNSRSQELTPPTHLSVWVRALPCTSIHHRRSLPSQSFLFLISVPSQDSMLHAFVSTTQIQAWHTEVHSVRTIS